MNLINSEVSLNPFLYANFRHHYCLFGSVCHHNLQYKCAVTKQWMLNWLNFFDIIFMKRIPYANCTFNWGRIIGPCKFNLQILQIHKKCYTLDGRMWKYTLNDWRRYGLFLFSFIMLSQHQAAQSFPNLTEVSGNDDAESSKILVIQNLSSIPTRFYIVADFHERP